MGQINLGQKILVQKYFDPKKYWEQKILGTENVATNNSSEKKLWSKEFLVQTKIAGPKNIWSKK